MTVRPVPGAALLAVFGMIALGGCLARPAAEPPAARCGATRLHGWIGQPVAALDDQYLPETMRLIRPGDMASPEQNPGRLNVTLDGAGRVVAFHCG